MARMIKSCWYFCLLLIMASSVFAVKKQKRPVRKCPHCHWRPASHNTLARHLRTHASQKAYTCAYPGCNHATFSPEGIQVHFKIKHGDLKKTSMQAALASAIERGHRELEDDELNGAKLVVLPDGLDPIIDAIIKG